MLKWRISLSTPFFSVQNSDTSLPMLSSIPAKLSKKQFLKFSGYILLKMYKFYAKNIKCSKNTLKIIKEKNQSQGRLECFQTTNWPSRYDWLARLALLHQWHFLPISTPNKKTNQKKKPLSKSKLRVRVYFPIPMLQRLHLF